GFGALSRVPSEPGRGPDVWFSEAALIGLGLDLELAAVRAALAHLESIPEPVFLSVNASPEAVASKGLQELLEPVPEGRVVLEITEHAQVKHYPPLPAAISYLR